MFYASASIFKFLKSGFVNKHCMQHDSGSVGLLPQTFTRALPLGPLGDSVLVIN